MSQAPFHRVEELFNQAVALPSEQRGDFLDGACANAPDLRAAVETLLRHDGGANDTTFRASPVARAADAARLDVPLPSIPGYELMHELGRGGMGIVYLARQTGLKRLVALKTLPAAPTTPEQLARFRIEAEALARLQHPNIVPIYDIGEFEGHPYFTMEYVAGPSLAALLDGRPQDVAASVQLLETLARAVDAVHLCGIVHRDLKPANILLQTHQTTDNTEYTDKKESGIPLSVSSGLSVVNYLPKISDFGLARDLSAPRRLTVTGAFMGTPCYMAPEQVRNERVGPAVDVYALGSILYELLTGRPPFDGGRPAETIFRLLHEEPLSPSRLRPKLPADLVTICLKCLEKSPRRRYARAGDLAEDLRRFREGEPIRARPVGFVGHAYRWCLRRPLVAGLLALSTLLAAAFVATILIYEAHLAATVRDERQQIVQLNVLIGSEKLEAGDAFQAVLRYSEALRLEEDEARAKDYRARIATALRNCPDLVQLRIREGRVICARIGPFEGWVATADTDGSIVVWEVVTGRQQGPTLRQEEAVRDGALSADGRFLATITASGTACVWDVVTGRSQTLPGRGKAAVSRVLFCEEGDCLVTEQTDHTLCPWTLVIDHLIPWKPIGGDAVVFSASSADALLYLTIDAAGTGQVYHVGDAARFGPPLRMEQPVKAAAFSPDGSRLVLAGADGSVRVWDVIPGAWLPGSRRLRYPVSQVWFSPDNGRVLLAGDQQSFEVWNLQTGDVLDLSPRDGGAVAFTHFSPDGQLLVVGNRGGARVWNVQTGQPITPPLRHGGPLAAASFIRNGERVVTVSWGGTVCTWDLTRPPQADEGFSADELLKLARLLACGRINEQQLPEPLEPRALRELWETLHPER